MTNRTQIQDAARHRGDHPVSVRARAVGRRLVIRIVDRGLGLAATELERVFEPFYRTPENRAGHTVSGSAPPRALPCSP